MMDENDTSALVGVPSRNSLRVLARQTELPRWRLEQLPAEPCREVFDTDAVVIGRQDQP